MSGTEAGFEQAPPDAIRSFREALALLRTRRFGTFWFASLLSNIGTWAQLVAQPWLLLSISGSAFLLGLDNFAMNAPVWLLTIYGGLLADRADRRRVITLFQSTQMLCPLLLAGLLLADAVRPWIIIALSLVVGVTDALSMPSFQSIVPSIVPRERIGAGLALNATQFNLSRILGPAIAGVLMSGAGVIGCYLASAASYVPFILVALWVLPRGAPPAAAAAAQGGRGLRGGVRAIMRAPALRGALLTVLGSSVLCGQLITFCPVLVSSAFHGSAAQFSAAIGAFGVGGLLGATGLLWVDARHDRRRISAWAATGYGVIVAATALNPWAPALPPLLVLAGIAMSVANTSANTFLLSAAEEQLRGRAVSLFMLAVRGGASLGGLLTGLAVGAIGVREALLVDGALALLLQAWLTPRWLRSATA